MLVTTPRDASLVVERQEAVEPAFELTQSLLESIQSSKDDSLIQNIMVQAKESDAKRTAGVEEARSLVKALSEELCNLRAKETLAETRDKDRMEHAKSMAALDREKFAVARSISEADESIARLEAQLADIQSKLAAVEGSIVEESSAPPDPRDLALYIYKGLGFELVQKDVNQAFHCLVMGSGQSGQADSIEFDDDHSRFFYANTLWDMCT